MIITIVIVSIALYGAWYYIEEFIFLEWVRKQAATKKSRYVIPMKEKRAIQRTYGDEFNTSLYNSVDECYEWQKYPHRKFATERDKWWIVNGKYDITQSFNWWQRYIYRKTGVWWYQGWHRKYKIRERKLSIGHYQPALNKGEEGKIVPLENNLSIYLFRTIEGYPIAITGAEDLTGNPVTVYLILPGRVANTYIADVEIGNWDELFPARVRATVASVIHGSHFYQGIPIDAERKAKYVEAGKKIPTNKDEIIEILREKLLPIVVYDPKATDPRQIIIANGGFEFSDVLVQDIIMENKEIVTEIANTVISDEKKKQKFNEAEGLAAIEEEPGMAKNRVLDERLSVMAKNKDMARLDAIRDSLKNANAISLGNTDAMFFDVPVENKSRTKTT